MLFFSAADVQPPPGVDLVYIRPDKFFNWNVFVNHEVPKAITDGFAMSVHEDGFPIQPDLWSPEFLDYDYIGAPWKDDVVGNGGFNIESQRLLREKLLVPFGRHNAQPSDAWVCRIHRARLEKRGIDFAPLSVAARFSTEMPTESRPESLPSFGFHGRRDSPTKYAQGWKLIEQSEKTESEIALIEDAGEAIKIAIVYIYAPLSGRKCRDYTPRFLKSYQSNPPGIDHDSIIVLNGTKLTPQIAALFNCLPNVRFLEHDNSGYDIGGFQHAARVVPCDMMVFFGQSTYFQGYGWLCRMREAFLKHGNAQYGTMGNRGNLHVKVWPHIRTTAFWMKPGLMNSYPKIITRPEDRHPFEYGPECLTNWVAMQGLKSWVVTWTSELLWTDWDSDPNGYSRGNQSSMIAGDRMCEPPYFKPGMNQPIATAQPKVVESPKLKRDPTERDRNLSIMQRAVSVAEEKSRRGRIGYGLSRPRPGEGAPYRCWG